MGSGFNDVGLSIYHCTHVEQIELDGLSRVMNPSMLPSFVEDSSPGINPWYPTWVPVMNIAMHPFPPTASKHQELWIYVRDAALFIKW